MTTLTTSPSTISELTEQLLRGHDLLESDARDLLHALADDDVQPAVKGALLGALRVKGETAAEVRGLALAMRERATTLPPGATVDEDLVDTCGTGGDGSRSLNLSTASALCAAACGLRVAKHGNGSVSSRSGSADVLSALGVPLPATAEDARVQLDRHGFTFLFAPVFHAATKGVGPVRRALGVRTVFNLLGPLTNPARPGRQLIGACDVRTAELLADALSGIPGLRRGVVVHGAPAWDEATPCGDFLRIDVEQGRTRSSQVDPRDLGFPRQDPDSLRGATPEENARRLEAALAGEDSDAHRDAIALNTGLVLEVAAKVPNLKDGIELARETLRLGTGRQLIEQLRGGQR